MKNEIKVGGIVLGALVSLFVLVILVEDISFEGEGQEYIIQFKNLNNLMEGAHVKLNGGFKIGRVNRFAHAGKMANIHISITKETVNKMILTEKVTFSIRSAGMLGEKYILLEFNDKTGKLFKFERDQNGNIIKPPKIAGEEPADMEAVIMKLSNISSIIEDILGKKLAPIFDKVNSPKISKIIDNVALASDHFNKLIKNSNSLVLDLKNRYLIDSFQEIKSISRDIRSLVITVNHGINNLFDHQTGIPDITYKVRVVLQNVNELVSLIRKVMSNLDDEDTPIGGLIKDKKMARDLKKVIRNLSELTEELKSSPMISTKKKYRPGPF